MDEPAAQPQPDRSPSRPPEPPVAPKRSLIPLPRRDGRGFLAGMRIRKKLIVLHTAFSLTLAIILGLALQPAVRRVVLSAEVDQAKLMLETLVSRRDAARPVSGGRAAADLGPEFEFPGRGSDVRGRAGTASELRLDPIEAVSAVANAGEAVRVSTSVLGPGAVLYEAGVGARPERYYLLAVRIQEARDAVWLLYALLMVSLLGVYALVAIALEVFVLPENVYRPIRRMLAADQAVQEGRREEELVPEGAIPSDELGEIMRSRNESVAKLRRQESALAEAIGQLESVASDLTRKNHLLETAQRNLADADRLASLGMMSAGIAHELNTPLTVLKGLVERVNQNPDAQLKPAEAALMLRVVQRLERLGESLLDFARVRPPRVQRVALRGLVEEAITLVRLDRDGRVDFRDYVDESIEVECDVDRVVQVLVNLLRNAAEASSPAVREGRAVSAGGAPARVVGGVVEVECEVLIREGRRWASLTITDNGPGIDASVLPHLFEPFRSTRLDSRGTGLGLAVAEGIVREHGGVILGRNRRDMSGAVFEVLLPVEATGPRAEDGVSTPPAGPGTDVPGTDGKGASKE